MMLEFLLLFSLQQMQTAMTLILSLFGEEHFPNCVKLSINIRKLDNYNCNSDTFTKLYTESNWCIRYSHRNSPSLFVGVSLLFSPLVLCLLPFPVLSFVRFLLIQ